MISIKTRQSGWECLWLEGNRVIWLRYIETTLCERLCRGCRIFLRELEWGEMSVRLRARMLDPWRYCSRRVVVCVLYPLWRGERLRVQWCLGFHLRAWCSCVGVPLIACWERRLPYSQLGWLCRTILLEEIPFEIPFKGKGVGLRRWRITTHQMCWHAAPRLGVSLMAISFSTYMPTQLDLERRGGGLLLLEARRERAFLIALCSPSCGLPCAIGFWLAIYRSLPEVKAGHVLF